eukprot:s40_g21.t1
MADAKSTVAFARAAVNFEVHESDFLVLMHDRVNTYESMAYRFPSSGDFEDYLKRSMRVKAGYRDDDGSTAVYPRPTIVEWEDYRSTEDVGCLRKLWGLSTQVAKRQLERLAGDDTDAKTKVTLATAQELEDRAVATGMPEPQSDRDRPALHTLARVQGAFGPGGTFQPLPWECFVTMEAESRLRRAGKLPRDKKEVVLEDHGLKLKSAEEEFPEYAKITDILTLKDVLQLRARAFHMMSVCPYNVAVEYGDKIVERLRATTPDGMRAPTLNEARRADREILSEILKWVAKGKGSVEAGLQHYSKETESEPLWKLLAQQPESHPDQGLEKSSKSASASDAAQHQPSGTKRPRAENKADSEAGDSDATRPKKRKKPRYCLVCHKRHEPRCYMPPGYRKQMVAEKGKGKGRPASPKKAADKKADKAADKKHK